MAGKEDYRVVKTKKALMTAFDTLIRAKKFEDITINELCDEAGVRRATFYKHFTDKYDFLAYAIRLPREEFDRKVWRRGEPDGSCEYYVKYAEALITYFSENTEIASSILGSDHSHSIIGMLIEQNCADTKVRLDKSMEGGLRLSVSTETMANILTGGITLVVARWFEDGMTTPKEKLIGEISLIIDALLT
ncbi:MAG: TetR/AcrR family transcriptional regulator [Clostridia bacterium]|nr:TetR/AcrR family transcriptional regulator [Clostridia bacterium]